MIPWYEWESYDIPTDEELEAYLREPQKNESRKREDTLPKGESIILDSCAGGPYHDITLSVCLVKKRYGTHGAGPM